MGLIIFTRLRVIRGSESSGVAVENCANPFKATPVRVPRSVIVRRGVSNTTGR